MTCYPSDIQQEGRQQPSGWHTTVRLVGLPTEYPTGHPVGCLIANPTDTIINHAMRHLMGHSICHPIYGSSHRPFLETYHWHVFWDARWVRQEMYVIQSLRDLAVWVCFDRASEFGRNFGCCSTRVR